MGQPACAHAVESYRRHFFPLFTQARARVATWPPADVRSQVGQREHGACFRKDLGSLEPGDGEPLVPSSRRGLLQRDKNHTRRLLHRFAV